MLIISFISPTIFISIAEDNNLIHQLSLIMLNKVCKAIKKYGLIKNDFERISVNFSASELLLDNFCEEVICIINKNKIPYEKIGIEITESEKVDDFSKIIELEPMNASAYLNRGCCYEKIQNFDYLILFLFHQDSKGYNHQEHHRLM